MNAAQTVEKLTAKNCQKVLNNLTIHSEENHILKGVCYGLEDWHIKDICQSFINNPNPYINHFLLGLNYISDQGVEYIFTMLQHPECEITKVDLSSNHITNLGVEKIKKFLSENKFNRNITIDLRNNPGTCNEQLEISTTQLNPLVFSRSQADSERININVPVAINARLRPHRISSP